MKVYKCHADFELNVNGVIKNFYKNEYYSKEIVESSLDNFIEPQNIQIVKNMVLENDQNMSDNRSLILEQYCESKELLLG